jgi:poly(3-hydroxybutyrate) depolymerase
MLGEGELRIVVDGARELAELAGQGVDVLVDAVADVHGPTQSMARGRLASTIAALVCSVLSGCGDPPAPVQATTATAAPTTAPALACEPSSARCLDDARLERCRADGSGADEERCGAGESCLGDGCAPLVAGGGPLERSALLVPRGGGWLDAWAAHGPIGDEAARDLVADPTSLFGADAAKRFTAFCRSDDFVTVHRERYDRDLAPRHHILIAWAVSSREQPVTFKIGVQGKARLFVGKDLVREIDAAGEDRPLRDEILAPVTLPRGATPVVLDVAQPDKPPTGFYLRIHGPDNQVPPGLRWALPHGLACPLAELVSVRPAIDTVAGGFAVGLDLRLEGLGPERGGAMPWRVELGEIKTPRPLVDGELAFDELVAGKHLSAAASFGREAEQPVALRLADTVRWKQKLVYRGELHERVAKLAEQAASLPERFDPDSRASFESGVATMTAALATGHADVSWLRARTTDLEALGVAFAAGDDPYPTRTGLVFRAYRSELDGRLQPYVVYVPPRHKPDGKPFPLVLVFHGLGQEPSMGLRHLIGAAPEEDDDRAWATRHLPPVPDLGAILAAPWGYDSAGARQLGEADVLAITERMQRHYRVDPQRIGFTGFSLGGTVAFVVPLHYPDLFSAAAPICGYPNLTTYQSIMNAPKQPFEELMIAKRYIVNYAENGLHLPLHIVHGGKDGPQRSAVVADRYRELGYRRTFDIQDDLAHDITPYAYEDGRMITWLCARARPEHPDHVRLRSAELRYHHAYWLDVDAVEDSTAFADVDARLDRSSGRLEVKTTNVVAFSVDVAALAAERLDAAVVDGAELPIAPAQKLHFVRSDGRFSLADAPPDLTGKKRPGVSGPLDDVLRHRVVVVFGTQDPLQTETNRMVAEHMSSWDTWSGAHFPVVADTDLGTDVAGPSLVLVGGPKSNRVTAELAPDLLATFDDHAITLRGKRYEGDDVGISFIQPHPRAAGEYLVVHAGVGWRGTLASRHLPRLAPDFLVYDGGITRARRGELLGERTVLAGGFFTDAWK